MKNYKFLIPLIVLLLVTLSCSRVEDFNAGVYIQTCDSTCGVNPTCLSSRGDMAEDEKAEMEFPIGDLYKGIAGGQAASTKSRKSVNATLTVTLEGEGSVKVTVKPAAGSTIVTTASKNDPAVITTDFQIKIRKFDEEKDGIYLVGIQVEPVDGTAEGVQLEMAVNECIDDYCASTAPNCK